VAFATRAGVVIGIRGVEEFIMKFITPHSIKRLQPSFLTTWLHGGHLAMRVR
jgi:hypothetical protein